MSTRNQMAVAPDLAAPDVHPAPEAGRYQIEQPVGHGASAEVFRAWDRRLQRFVALKRLSPPESARLASYQETVREATHLAAVQHPNVVSVYDLSEDEVGPFLIMELVEGETLEAVVSRGAFPLEDFADLAEQALEGLAAAHQVGLLHCDLKPANIMLKHSASRTLQVKLLDFGIASFWSEKDQPAAPAPDGHGHMTVLGTVEFMAPEQFEQAPMSEESDVYSLGCIFYYALAGFDPFRGQTINDIMVSHLEHRVTPLATVRQDLPPALSDWIMRLIDRLPGQRPASAVAALTELKGIIRQATANW